LKGEGSGELGEWGGGSRDGLREEGRAKCVKRSPKESRETLKNLKEF